MAHQQDDNVLEAVMQLLTENGFDGLADRFRILVNEAMKAERSHVLQARPHQRQPWPALGDSQPCAYVAVLVHEGELARADLLRRANRLLRIYRAQPAAALRAGQFAFQHVQPFFNRHSVIPLSLSR